MSVNAPLVSIIIPVYNGSNYLNEAIESALSQTYENCEIVVINDGSDDDGATEQVVMEYGERIRYFYKENGGVASALNMGIKEMKGEYFSWLSHDDLYHPQKIEQQVKLLQFQENIKIALCENNIVDKHSKTIKHIKRRRSYKNNTYIEPMKVLVDLLANDSFYGCSLLIHRSVFNTVGYFNANLKYCQDYLMWLLIAFRGFGLVYSEEELVSLRVHENQLTQTGRELYHNESIVVGDAFFSEIEGIEEKKSLLLLFAKRNAIFNNKKVYKECIMRMKESGQFSFYHYIQLTYLREYGLLRPYIRKLYYLIIHSIKTE